MRRRQTDSIESTLDKLVAGFTQIDRRAEKMETILMVREPGSAAAADAYDGLRKQVVSAMTERLAHLTQLVQFDAAMRNGATADVLAKMVSGWCESVGLMIVSTPEQAPADADVLFELVEDRGGPLQVIDPAYVDATSGRVIRQGRAVRRAPDSPPPSLTDREVRATDGSESVEAVESSTPGAAE